MTQLCITPFQTGICSAKGSNPSTLILKWCCDKTCEYASGQILHQDYTADPGDNYCLAVNH